MNEDEVTFKDIMSLADDLGLSYNTKRENVSEEDILRTFMTKSLLVMEELDDFRTKLNKYSIDNGYGDIFTVTGLDSAIRFSNDENLTNEVNQNV